MKIEFRCYVASLAAVCTMVMPGCTLWYPGYKPPIRMKDTPRFYSPRIDSPRAPKPDDAPMPVLVYPPKRPYVVLGDFRMRSKRYNYDFMTQAAQYNARKLGADAVLVRERWVTPYNYVYYPNPTTSTEEVDDPQSKADRKAGKAPTSHTETTTERGDPATGTADKDYLDAEIIIYK